MNTTDQILVLCSEIAHEISCDFVGLAIYNPQGKELRWMYAVGNRNEKYRRIVVRYGKGIAGQVIRTGRPMTISQFPQNIIGKATDYPIMLAEQLISALAYPIHRGGIPWGVLLIGNRSESAFSKEQQDKIKKVVINIENMIKDPMFTLG